MGGKYRIVYYVCFSIHAAFWNEKWNHFKDSIHSISRKESPFDVLWMLLLHQYEFMDTHQSHLLLSLLNPPVCEMSIITCTAMNKAPHIYRGFIGIVKISAWLKKKGEFYCTLAKVQKNLEKNISHFSILHSPFFYSILRLLFQEVLRISSPRRTQTFVLCWFHVK